MALLKRLALVLTVVLFATLAPVTPSDAVVQATLAPCQVSSNGGVNYAGFPLTPSRIDSIGSVRAAVLFVDFSDAPNSETTTTTLARRWSSSSADYLEAASYGALDFELVPHNSWLRMPDTSSEYQSDALGLLDDAIAAADPVVDFTGIDTFFVLPEPTSDFFTGITTFSPYPTENGTVELTGGNVFSTAFVSDRTDDLDEDESFMISSLLLLMGLRPTSGEGTSLAEQRRYTGNFGFMGRHVGHEGGVLAGAKSVYNGGELLAWQRWQLGWITDSQVDCLTGPAMRTELSGLSQVGGIKLAAVKLDGNRVLVVEARTQRGYDRDLEDRGVLVYIVDSTVRAPNAAFEVQGSYDGDFPDGSVLRQSPTLVIEGFRVSLELWSTEVMGITLTESGQQFCSGEFVTIDMNTNGGDGQGTEGDDVILGTPNADTILGGGGDDTICAGGGDDVISGEAGADEMFGNDGDDKMWGGQGADRIAGGAGDDTLHGNRGDDTLDGQNGNDKIFGYAHNDFIRGGQGDDRLHGNFGDDRIMGGPGNDRLFGYGDNDTLIGGGGDDLLGGNFGDDVLDGAAENSGFVMGSDDDVLYGSDGDDTLRGGAGNDLVQGNSGNDILEGGYGDDELDGGINVDSCEGDNGTDTAIRCETITGVP